ncbi:MAG TPA: C4-dicarboxylate ABC transporter [Gammaproteobacteria bacterium]|nr:C4-dicarboxylate ABC transporter [Gammaproteobacteria bacterium]
MPKRILLALLMLLPLTGAATTFKIATLSPDGSSWMQKFRAAAKTIRERTDGRVKFKFYPGGVMGDDKAVLRKIRIRQLQGGAIASGALSAIYPDSQIYNLPMQFRNLAEVDAVRARLDQRLLDGLKQKGFVSFGIAEGGFAYLLSQYPITTVAELRRHKAWVPDIDRMSREAIEAFDIQPIPLPMGDVLTALQTGLVDTVAAPPIVTLALQWHTQVKYLLDLPLLYSYALMIIDKRAFDRLKPSDQKIVHEVMGRTFREIDRQNRVDNEQAMTALRQQGIEFLQPAPAAREEWESLAAKARRHLRKIEHFDPQLMAILQQTLDEMRGTH